MPPPKSIDLPSFVTTQLALLQAELEAELSESSLLISTTAPAALSRAGLAITNLSLASQRTGLGGKTVLELVLDSAYTSSSTAKDGKSAILDLPGHGIRVGDIVLVAQQPSGSAKKREAKELEGKGVRGVVTKVTRGSVSVALDPDSDKEDEGPGERLGNGGRLWVVKAANEVTYRRMKGAIEKMGKMGEAEWGAVMRGVFGGTNIGGMDWEAEIEWVDGDLNESQKEAIRFALGRRDIALIHGPPGTGKTHTLIELILQFVKLNLRVLVCGPSNISVDNIVERLSPHKIPLVRLGHPARLLPSVLNHSLDVLTQTSEAAAIVRDVRQEMDAKQASIRKTRNGRERRAIYSDLRELRKEFREREKRCVSEMVGGSRVVAATLHGAGGFQLKNENFDVVVIDEASQALEAQCWVSLISAHKVVLAGDHLQLPPTIKSLNTKIKPRSSNGSGSIKGMTLETTLFDRLLDLHGPSIKRMLTTQYRMHEKIMRFPSDEVYDGKLIAADRVKDRLLKDLLYDVTATEDTCEPLIFWDTQGGDFPEKEEQEDPDRKPSKNLMGESKSNENEALLVRLQVKKLVGAGVNPEDIAIITPYNAQLAIMSTQLKESYPGIELGSVDGFQGREKEVVIVSLVRSNDEHEVGFLSEKRRLNDYTSVDIALTRPSYAAKVAMTRPKRSLIVIGDSETVSKGSKFLARWMEHLEANADLRYPDLTDLNVL